MSTENPDVRALEEILASVSGLRGNIQRDRYNISMSSVVRRLADALYPDTPFSHLVEETLINRYVADRHVRRPSHLPEPADMAAYVKTKEGKVALEEIKERAKENAPTKPRKK